MSIRIGIILIRRIGIFWLSVLVLTMSSQAFAGKGPINAVAQKSIPLDALGTQEDDHYCPQCYQEFRVGDTVSLSTCCYAGKFGLAFHTKCIQEWMNENPGHACFVCRKEFKISEPVKVEAVSNRPEKGASSSSFGTSASGGSPGASAMNGR